MARLARDHRGAARDPDAEFQQIAEEIRAAGFTHAVLLGMGGSSLCVEVLKLTFGRLPGFPEFLVLDSTDPAQIKAIESKLDLAKTIFIVSSKSGSTLEPNIFKQYFFERVKQGRRRGQGRQALHRHHRSRLEHAESRRGRRLPPHLLRAPEHRRPLFGAFRFRHDSRRDSGNRRSRNFSTAPKKWPTPALRSCRPTKIPA